MKNILILFLFNLFFYKIIAQSSVINGIAKYYYDNGKISSEGLMKDAKPDGYWKNYYKNGKIKIEGNRKNYLLDSLWKFYNEQGKINKTVFYKLGKKNGPTIFYDTLLNIISKENYINDIKNGLDIYYYSNHKTKNITPYLNGKKNGTVYEYSEDSLITEISVYINGILQSFEKINQVDQKNKKQGIWKEFHPNLLVKKEMKYNDDSLDGYIKDYDIKGNLVSTQKFNNGKKILNAPELANVEVYRDVYEDGLLKYEGVFLDGLAIGTHYKYIRKNRCDSTLYLRDDTSRVFLKRMVCRLEPIPDSAIEYFDGTVIARGAVDSIRKRIGTWYEYHNTGEFRAKGVYKEGKRIGNWEFFYSSGSLEQKGGYNKKGNEQGPWIWFYESGKTMRQENYVNGNREGELIDYNELGDVILKGNYLNNNKDGLWLYETKEYKEIGKYSENEPDSLWRSYHLPSKNKRFEGSFLTGVPIGIHTFYHYNGQKMNSGNYSAGMKDGDWKYYDEEGFNYLTIEYKNDIEIKWQGKKIKPTYEESLRTYNITIDGNKTQTIKRK